jgi:hypothetical protein
MRKYRDMKLFNQESQDLDAHVQMILENRKREQELASLNREPFDESYDEKAVEANNQ